jgi:hypothetical protein
MWKLFKQIDQLHEQYILPLSHSLRLLIPHLKLVDIRVYMSKIINESARYYEGRTWVTGKAVKVTLIFS